jgi:transcriptional regulator with XRE-family HTH domain
MDINLVIAENIKRIRKTQKMSIERTAEIADVSRSMLGQIERGEANPSVAIIGKLAKALKVPADLLLENDSFESLAEYPEVKTKPKRFDAGKVVLRENFSYDEVTRLESYFLDLYISGKYEAEPSVPGCICYATVMSGTASLQAEGQTFRLLERDAIRFAADQPYRFENMTNASARLMLVYQYLK